jgi:hypothetical protein
VCSATKRLVRGEEAALSAIFAMAVALKIELQEIIDKRIAFGHSGSSVPSPPSSCRSQLA